MLIRIATSKNPGLEQTFAFQFEPCTIERQLAIQFDDDADDLVNWVEYFSAKTV